MVTVFVRFRIVAENQFVNNDMAVRITEELVRKRAEHNDGLLYTLEELSLHQLDIERIENIDKWSPRLQILYLQGNLISKIENVGRLKWLTYLNLAMNNISLIENLSGCESLIKLDLTVNFICKLSSVDDLKENYNLKELYLMGNPCASYNKYRPYVITTLSQLNTLDGSSIKRSERILALQNFDKTKIDILEEETAAEAKRLLDTQYRSSVDKKDDDDDEDEEFWTKKSSYTPESRLKLHRHLQRAKQSKGLSFGFQKKENASERKLTNKDGRMLNVNEPRIDFKFSEAGDALILEVAVYRYLDTSLLDVDVQPNFVRIFIKQKLLQLVLEVEVKPDQSVTQRSQTTGHLIVMMPKVSDTLMPIKLNASNLCSKKNSNAEQENGQQQLQDRFPDDADVIPELI